MKVRGYNRYDVVAIAFAFVFGAAVATWHLSSFFDGFDFSGFLDVYYRISRSQVPYRDFFFNAGPVHPYIGGTLFKLFGPGRDAIFVNVCLLSLFVSVFSYSTARSSFGRVPSAALTLLCVLFFLGPVSFPVYDQHAWAFVLAAVAALRLELSKSAPRAATLRGMACGIALGLAFLTKSNIAAGSLPCIAAALAVLPRRDRSLPWFALCLLLVPTLILLALGTPLEFLSDNFVNYAATDRLFRFRWLFELGHELPTVPLALTAAALTLAGGRELVRHEKRDLVILFGLLLATTFVAWTSSMTIDLNCFLVGVELLFLLKLASRLPEARARRAALVILSVVAALSFITAAERTGRWFFYQKRLPPTTDIDYEIRSEPLAGWSCHRSVCEGMDAAVDFLKANAAPGDSLFVFPDLTVIYLLTGLESYRGAPYQFVLGEAPPPGEATQIFKTRLLEHPPKWVVLHYTSYLPMLAVNTELQLKELGLGEFFEKRYVEAWTNRKTFRVLRLKNSQ